MDERADPFQQRIPLSKTDEFNKADPIGKTDESKTAVTGPAFG